MKGKVFSQGSQFFLQENFFHPKAAGALSCCHHVRGFIFKTSEDFKFFFFLIKKSLLMFLSLFALSSSSLGCALLVPLLQETCSILSPKSRWTFWKVHQSPCKPVPLQPLNLFLPKNNQNPLLSTPSCLK